MPAWKPPLSSILSLSWDEYTHALQVRLAAWQVRNATWARWPVTLDEVRDKSWVDSLALFRERCAGVPLLEMDDDAREILIGDYDAGDGDDDTRRNTYFFGNIQGAGRPTSVIRYGEHWPKLVPVLDAARTTARGLPRRPAPAQVTAPWTAIGSLDRFGAASASRLLVAERPDLYLMLNNASRSGLASITGVPLPVMLQVPGVDRHYRDMLERVYASPWWGAPRPRPLRDAFIWDCRVALLDVFAYDEDWKKNA